MRWLINLPRVLFELTDGSTQEMASGAIVTAKGGMNGDAFEQWLDEAIYPMFPDLAPEWKYDDDGNVVMGPAVLKLDGGPGRLGPASRAWRLRAAQRGLLIFPGLQNATSVNQEMDDLYSLLQQSCGAVTDEIVAERVAIRAAEDDEDIIPVKDRTKVQLTNCDLGRIVCGRESDDVELRPFERSFTPERIVASWCKIGAAPCTRAGLEQSKVRHEAIEGDPKLGDLLALEERHTTNVTALEAKGANVNVFKAKLPRRAIIARATGPAAQLQALVENGVAHSSVWHHCGAIALNSDVVLAAEGARLVAERDAAAATQQQQQSDLSLLRDQAIAIETQREIDTKEYVDLTAAQRATIIKCLFQLKGMTGFSKIKGKPAEVSFLEGYEEDVIDALNGPLPTAGATAAAGGGDAASATAAGASSGDGQRGGGASTAVSHRSTEQVDRDLAAAIKARQKSDAQMTALIAERAASAAVE